MFGEILMWILAGLIWFNFIGWGLVIGLSVLGSIIRAIRQPKPPNGGLVKLEKKNVRGNTDVVTCCIDIRECIPVEHTSCVTCPILCIKQTKIIIYSISPFEGDISR